MSVHGDRPFNTRYVVWSPVGGDAQRSTHRTATASYFYINRMNGIDDVGPTPNWAARTDLVDRGRVGPSRARQISLDGIALWTKTDEAARAIRPTEATLAHCVGSLPANETLATWRDMIEGFCEDHLASQGMVVDWAVHHQAEGEGRRAIPPHVHMLVTTRVYDPSHPDHGRRRQCWLRTPASARLLAERWYALTGLYPPQLGSALANAA